MTKSKAQDRDRPGGDPGPAVLPQGSLGAWLRAQREARGVGLREIAESSKISLRYLEALEADRFEVLPAPVFTRGFLREYARVVGLDPDEVVNLYLVVARDREQQAAAPAPGAEPAAARPRGTGPSALGYGLLLLLAVAILLGLAALISWWSGRRAATPAEDAAAAELAVEAPRPGSAGAAPGPPASDLADEVPAAAPPAAPQGSSAAPPPIRVVLEFGQDCWVELVVDGRRRTSELRASGELLRLEAADHVLLTLGNVEGVRVEVDGRPMPLPAGPRVVRDLRIDRQLAARLAGTPAT
jgi:cytoskeleton protein RodZ